MCERNTWHQVQLSNIYVHILFIINKLVNVILQSYSSLYVHAPFILPKHAKTREPKEQVELCKLSGSQDQKMCNQTPRHPSTIHAETRYINALKLALSLHNTWGHPNIQVGIQTYSGYPKIWGYPTEKVLPLVPNKMWINNSSTSLTHYIVLCNEGCIMFHLSRG